MPRRDNFFILIKWHYNPTTNEVGKKKLVKDKAIRKLKKQRENNDE